MKPSPKKSSQTNGALAINNCLCKNQGNFNYLTTSGKKQQAEEEEALRKRPQSVDQSNVQSKKVSVIREKFESPSPSASPTRFGPHSFVLLFLAQLIVIVLKLILVKATIDRCWLSDVPEVNYNARITS